MRFGIGVVCADNPDARCPIEKSTFKARSKNQGKLVLLLLCLLHLTDLEPKHSGTRERSWSRESLCTFNYQTQRLPSYTWVKKGSELPIVQRFNSTLTRAFSSTGISQITLLV